MIISTFFFIDLGISFMLLIGFCPDKLTDVVMKGTFADFTKFVNGWFGILTPSVL